MRVPSWRRETERLSHVARERRKKKDSNVLELVDELFEREGPVVVLDGRSSKLEVVEIGDALRLVSLEKRNKKREKVRNETRPQRVRFSPCS